MQHCYAESLIFLPLQCAGADVLSNVALQGGEEHRRQIQAQQKVIQKQEEQLLKCIDVTKQLLIEKVSPSLDEHHPTYSFLPRLLWAVQVHIIDPRSEVTLLAGVAVIGP